MANVTYNIRIHGHGCGLFSVFLAASSFSLICIPANADNAFRHPGVFLDESGMEATRQALVRKEPAKLRALEQVLASPLAKLDYTPSPVEKVTCGPHSKPDVGCKAEVRDAQAAYTHALLWAYQRDVRHARTAIAIMNTWSNTLTGRHSGGNASLQAAWAAQMWTRAAEIVRHTSKEWREVDARHFGSWLVDQYLSDINRMGPCLNGNWQASAIEAEMGIGVYTDRRDIYERAVARWRAQLPAYVYLPSDGRVPRSKPGCNAPVTETWFKQTVFVAGIAQETCRDLRHTAFGLAAFFNAAETNRLQGGSLYRDEADRLQQAMEFQTGIQDGRPTPKWLCGGRLDSSLAGTFEVGYAQFNGRMGRPMTNTRRWLEGQGGAMGTKHFLWESLTHGIDRMPERVETLRPSSD